MDQFKTLYFDYCQTYSVQPNETILGEIEKYDEVVFFVLLKSSFFYLYEEVHMEIIK